MSSLFKKWITRAIPKHARIVTRRGKKLAEWEGRAGKKSAELTEAGNRIKTQSLVWYGKYRNADGLIVEESTGHRDKRLASQTLNEWINREERISAGVYTQEDMQASEANKVHLLDLLDSFVNHLQAKGSAGKYVKDTRAELARLFHDCKFHRLTDLHRDTMEQWLVDQCSAEMSARTRNKYLQALNGFCNWAVATKRLPFNPVAGIKRANERKSRKRTRRALTDADVRRLLEAARHRPLAELGRRTVAKPAEQKPCHPKARATWTYEPLTFDAIPEAIERAKSRCTPETIAEAVFEGRERELVYRVALYTGLRRGEIASLTVGSLDLESRSLSVDAAYEKAGRGAVIPVRSDLLEALREWLDVLTEHHSLERLPASTPLFCVPTSIVRRLDADLELAGIPKEDELGRTVDFHALRHIFGTNLSRADVHIRTAQKLMRHSDIKLTMGVYTDASQLDDAGAVEALPAF